MKTSSSDWLWLPNSATAKAGEDHLAEQGDLAGLLPFVREVDQFAVDLDLRHVGPLAEPQRPGRRAAEHADLHLAVRLSAAF